MLSINFQYLKKEREGYLLFLEHNDLLKEKGDVASNFRHQNTLPK